MSCDYPITAYYSREVNPSGKRSLVFNDKGALSGIPLKIPCGRCTGCRLERSRVWAIRCLHEAKMHKANCFITLTYADKHLPADWSIRVRVLQLFLKRLRKCIEPIKYRYYGCGEYGDLSDRPHYHALIFGYEFPDKRFYAKSPAGYDIYSSAMLNEIWGFGDCKIGEVNFETAAYVARYCMKKISGDAKEAHYKWIDEDGVIHECEPEFALMSRRPGLGTAYYDKYGQSIRDHDSLIVNSKEVPSIRFYDLKFEQLDAAAFKRVKRKRHPVAKYGRKVFLIESSSARMRAKALLKDALLKRKERKL